MNNRTLCWFILAVLFVLFPLPGIMAAGISVQAILDPPEFSLDEAARLTVTVQGAQDAETPQPSGSPGLEFSFQGRSQQFQWINGKASAAITFTYWVQANQAGECTIDPVKIKVNGNEYASDPIHCRVTTGQAGPDNRSEDQGRSASSASRQALLQLIPDKSTAYVGELIPFTLRLCLRANTRARLHGTPRIDAEHLTLQEMDQHPRQSEEIIDGQAYDVLTWNGMLAGIKAGAFALRAGLEIKILIRTKRPASPGPWQNPLFNDPFFDQFMGSFIEKNLNLASEPLTITVHDTPEEGKPADFRGAVGNFSLAVSATPTRLKVGDPITLKILVSGTGNFDRVHVPQLQDSQGWKLYTASSQVENEGHGKGKKEFEQAIIPVSSTITAIPALSFSFFDPEAESYVTLHTDPIPIHLEDNQDTGSISGSEDDDRQGAGRAQDAGLGLAPQHRDMGRMVDAIVPLYRQTWFRVTLLLSLFFLFLVAFLWMRTLLQRRNPSRNLKKILNRNQRKLARELNKAMQDGDSRRFLHLVRQTIREHLEFQWQRPAEAITLADLEKHLGHGALLTRIYARVEHGIYTHDLPQADEMRRILDELNRALEALQ